MKEPRLPGFITDASGHEPSNNYHIITTSLLPLEEGKIVPQQECFTFSGKCTGFWPWYQGTQCVTGLSGEQMCCTSASTYPAQRECRNPDGSWRVVNSFCGYCWW
jgi:hypothetical protein